MAVEPTPRERPVLVVDVGGQHVKARATGESEKRRFASGPTLDAAAMVRGVLELVAGWQWEVVSVGIPAPVHGGRVVADAVRLGGGWAGVRFAGAFGSPPRA